MAVENNYINRRKIDFNVNIAPVAILVNLTNLKKGLKNMGYPVNKTKIVCTVGPTLRSGRS